MKRIVLLLAIMTASIMGVAACDSGKPGAPKEETALMSPPGSAGREQNDEGVGHYRQGHWDVAEGHFRKALNADANLAVAHFNLALTLDKEGKHEAATASFKKAAELGAANPAIKDSVILKKHTGM